MQCFVAGHYRDERQRDALDALVGSLGRPLVAVRSLAALADDQRYIRTPRALVIVAEAALDPIPIEDVVTFAQEHQGHAFIVYVADAVASDAYKQLVRTGNADWIRWQDGVGELAELATRLAADALGERSARVISFLPSKGGVGNTTLAVETAMCMSERRKRGGRIALVDLNFQGGTLADAFDIEARFDVADVIGHPERLDEQLIDVFTSQYAQRLDVFASPARMVRPDEVGPQIVFSFIDRISARYDAILLDLPPYWLPWIDSLLQGSDAVVVSGSTNVPALRKLSAKLSYLKGLGIPQARIAAVLTRAEVDLFGRIARKPELERVLAGQHVLYVRRDHAAFDEAADVGRPLMDLLPNSRIARDIRRLDAWIESGTGTIGKQPTAMPRQGSAA